MYCYNNYSYYYQNMKKTKIYNLSFTLSFFVLFIGMGIWWDQCIQTGDCAYDIVRVWLRPIYYSSLSLSLFFAFFLFLPAHYFTAWLKWIFSFAFPISALIVMSNISQGGGLFPIFAREVIILLSIFWGVVTLLFVGFRYFKLRK